MHQSPTFAQLLTSAPLLRALERKGYTHPTPIQAGSIPPVLAGNDLLGLAQTGTGKTAAFALPVLQRLSESNRPSTSRGGVLPRCLVLTPTRELCVQVADNFKAYGADLPLRLVQIFGGVGEEPQRQALRRGADIIVATPGRLLDFLNQGAVSLERVEVLVLDEADRMLDMGFLPDVKRIVSHVPKERQTLLFSATMPNEIAGIAAQWLRNPKRVEVAPVSSTPERIDQSVYFIEKSGKPVLLREVVVAEAAKRVLVFSRTKHGADRICRNLEKQNLSAFAIHGNKSQGARQKALNAFRDGEVRILVATDLAARGIDVKGIDLVVNYDLPNEPETYVHRIGRTARAGAEGKALSFCSREERPYLRSIERLTQLPIEVRAIPEGLEQLNTIPMEMDDGGDRRRERGPARGRSQGGQGQARRSPAQGSGQARVSRPSGERTFQTRQSAGGSSSGGRSDGQGSRGGQSRNDGHASRTNSRNGYGQGGQRSNSPARQDRGEKPSRPEVLHENKAPLWTRLVNHFTGKPEEKPRETYRR